ncbi:Nipped-B-like protein [Dirofilaria immitis]
MEGSTSCTSDSDVVNTSRESEIMVEMRNAATPASGSNNSSFINEAPSPLGHLDPHRLRDMVVDKQTACQTQVESPYKQPYWTPSPADPSQSPSNIRSVSANSNSPLTPIMQPPRFPNTVRDSALLSPSVTRTPVQQQAVGMCLPVHSPMGSPSGTHPPPSPFISRSSSNASLSPYMQPSQAPIHYQANLQSPAGVVPSNHVPTSPPSASYLSRITAVGSSQQQYSCHAQMQQPQWTSQQTQQHFGSGPVHRVMVQRVPYSGYPPGMSQLQSQNNQHPSSSTVFPAGASRAPVTPASRGTMYSSPSLIVPQHSSGSQPTLYPPQSCYQTKGQQQPKYALQSPVYRQQQPQSVSVRTYIGNQPSSLSTSSAYQR